MRPRYSSSGARSTCRGSFGENLCPGLLPSPGKGCLLQPLVFGLASYCQDTSYGASRKSKAPSSARVTMKFEVWVMVQLFCGQELRVQCWSVPPLDCSTFSALSALLENMDTTDDISGVNKRPEK